MRYGIVLALVVGLAGWGATLASAQVSTTCAANSGVTVTNPLTIANGSATVGVTVAQGCTGVQLSLVSYQAPSGTYSEQTADQQVLYRSTTQTLSAGSYTLSVDVPSCYYQLDLVYGSPIQQLGPAGTDNFYGKQGRLISTMTGGSSVCTPPPPTCPSQNKVTLDNGGVTIAGGVATVHFTVAAGCSGVQLSLVSYQAPSSTYNEQTASEQVLYRSATDTFDSGSYTLSVAVPSCYYQVDFVYGTPIQQLGPAGTNNFYGKQGRLIEALNGGTSSCQTGETGGVEMHVTICHATSATTYVAVSPTVSDVVSEHLGRDTGDIIPPFTVNGTTYSQNWDSAGQAIYANGCAAVSTSTGGGQTQTPPPTQTQTQTPVTQQTPPPVPLPSITLVKLERIGATGDFTTGPIAAKVGDTIEYQLVVRNTGTTDVSVDLLDAGCTSLLPAGPQAVKAGASLTYTCSHVVTSADGASYTNLAIATANNAGPVKASVQSTVTANIGTVAPTTVVGGVKGAHKTVRHKVVHHKVKKVVHKAKAAHAVRARAHVTG